MRVIQSLCDVCHDEDKMSVGTTITVTLNGLGPALLDLCDEHQALFIKPLSDLILSHGMTEDGKSVKPAERSPRGQGEVECEVCGKPMSSVTSLSSHMKNKHPDDYPAYMQARGMEPIKCKVKGCGQTFYGQQAISMHMTRSHP